MPVVRATVEGRDAVKARPATSGLSLEQALERAVYLDGRVALFAYLRDAFEFWNPELDDISMEKYGIGIDERCGWDTYLVSVDGKAAVFTDGPLPDEKLADCVAGWHSFNWRMGIGTCRYCFERKKVVG